MRNGQNKRMRGRNQHRKNHNPMARVYESNGPDVSHADGDYGTRFLATAGVFNLLAALHAYEAARGRKA